MHLKLTRLGLSAACTLLVTVGTTAPASAAKLGAGAGSGSTVRGSDAAVQADDGVYTFSGTLSGSGTGVQANDGTYTFSQLACSFVAAESASADQCSMTTSGTFTNIVCGTGTANGAATITSTSLVGGGGQSDTLNYGIVFVGGIGVLTGQFAEGSQALGVVNIVPTGGGGTPNTTDCTDNFELNGAMAVQSQVQETANTCSFAGSFVDPAGFYSASVAGSCNYTVANGAATPPLIVSHVWTCTALSPTPSVITPITCGITPNPDSAPSPTASAEGQALYDAPGNSSRAIDFACEVTISGPVMGGEAPAAVTCEG